MGAIISLGREEFGMSFDDSVRECIRQKLDNLSESTQVSLELVNILYGKGLISDDEHQVLEARERTNYRKATILYTKVTKWTNNQLETFLDALKQTGNLKATELISNTVDSSNHLKLIVQNLSAKSCTGSYEGFYLKDETAANNFATKFTKSRFFKEVQFDTNYDMCHEDRLIKLLKPLINLLKGGKVWWNSSKPQLPHNYVSRKLTHFKEKPPDKQSTTLLELLVSHSDGNSNWKEWADHVLVLLVDSPGMGKSSALTKLEMDLRIKLNKKPRLIIRLNLNEIECPEDLIPKANSIVSIEQIIERLFPPLDKLTLVKAPVYLLLDGLDEVHSNNQEIVLNILRLLLSDTATNVDGNKLFVEKVVLTTRPHLKELIESEFNVQAYSLLPLNEEEQILVLGNGKRKKDIKSILDQVPHSMRELMSNPLMLELYRDAILSKDTNNTSKLIDQNEIYEIFMIRKHELAVVEKKGQSHATKRVLKKKLKSNIPYYYYIAVYEIISANGWEKVKEEVQKVQIDLLEIPTGAQLHELLSFGVVVQVGGVLKFKHRSFAEYFYVVMMMDTDETPPSVRNILFALGYEEKSNIAEFVSCVMRRRTSLDFLSRGWTGFIPEEAQLSRYQDESGALLNHIFTYTINLACTSKTRILVTDCVHDKLLISWLQKQELRMIWGRDILKMDHMAGVTVGLILACSKERRSLLRYLFFEFEENPCKPLTYLSLLVRMFPTDRLKQTRKDIAYAIRLWIEMADSNFTEEFFTLAIFIVSFSNWLFKVFTKDDLINFITNEETRVCDIGGVELYNVYRRWGKEFSPDCLLQFRRKFGKYKFESLFQFKTVPETFMNVLWNDIENKLEDAIRVIYDDKNLSLLRALNKSLRYLELKTRKCLSRQSASVPDSGSSQTILLRRIQVVWSLLVKVNWCSKLREENWFWDAEDLSYLVSYNLFRSSKWGVALKCEQIQTSSAFVEMSGLFKRQFVSALNEQYTKGLNNGIINAPFEIVLDWLKTCNNKKSIGNRSPLLDIISGSSAIREFEVIFRMESQNPYLLSDWPSVWEVMFLPGGIAYTDEIKSLLKEKMTEFEWEKVVWNILISIRKSTVCCCSVGAALGGITELLIGSNDETSVLVKVFESQRVLREIAYCTRKLWLENLDITKCYFMGVLNIYKKAFGVEPWWISRLAEYVPVQLLIVGEEYYTAELVTKVEQVLLLDMFNNEISLCKISKFDFRYNRSCDWYRLLTVFPQLRDSKIKIPFDYRTQTERTLDWEASILRVWIQIFGEEQTRVEADERNFNEDVSLWEKAANYMRDGELLHIAVQVGSLLGVKRTSWPAMVKWKDEKNGGRTAIEFSTEKWGSDHPITQFLRNETCSIISTENIQ